LKNKLTLEYINNDSLQLKLLKILGLDSLEMPLSFKHTKIDNSKIFGKKRKDIDHLKSEHSMSIQKSKYIVIEDNVSRLQKYANIIAESQQAHNQNEPYVYNHIYKDNHLNLRFCNSEEVTNKRNKFYMFKCQFLRKIS